MKNTISVYWPLAVIVPLLALACLHLNGHTASRESQMPPDADRVSAELARAVSYGMIDAASALPVRPMRATRAAPLAAAS